MVAERNGGMAREAERGTSYYHRTDGDGERDGWMEPEQTTHLLLCYSFLSILPTDASSTTAFATIVN
ncbi:unnamed protein product [Onchocerca flexuosa]|uniref:Uncharacterized protein n=1 Tax=Onchocerca flexuosa TaxID=387005 RepID=A0A183HKR7_9BILA|nr:unnamed protein product [Onchocerca flexuosa]